MFYNPAFAVFVLRIPKGNAFKASFVYWYAFYFHCFQSANTEFML